MTKKTELLEEMKGQTRAFRIDRDTLIIYTGRDKSDLQPFVRIGAGDDIPHGILPHIENVVVPESNLWNLGLEMAWQNASLQQGVKYIRYVGGKDRVSQLYNYTRISEKDDENHREKVKLLPYAKTSLQNVKEKSFITFFTGGNMNVQVNGSKVIDFENYTRSKIGLDKEYDLMIKVQSKMDLRAKNGLSFIFYGTEDGRVPSILWNMDGEGMFMNPIHEYPYALFESLLRVDNISMVTTSNPYGPGFVEAIRRQNALKSQIGMYCPFPEQSMAMKKLYSHCRINIIVDAKTLPFHKSTTYYVSKSGSHGLLSMKMADKAEEPVKILIPLGLGKKISKSFDYAKGPFDLAFTAANVKGDLQVAKDARLKIHYQGKMKPQSYLGLRLEECVYPAVPNAEYKMLYTEDSNSITNMLIGSIEGSGFEENVHALSNYILSGERDESKLREILTILRKTKVPQSVFHRINLHELFRFLKNHSAYDVSVKPIFQKAIDRIQSRFGLRKIKVKDLISMQGIFMEVEVIFDGGIETYLLYRNVEKNIPFALQFPPRSGDFDFMADHYKAILKQQNKILDKMQTEVPGYRAAVEMMEKLMEDRKLMFEERVRLGELLDLLGMTFQPQPQSRYSIFLSYLPESIQKFFANMNLRKTLDGMYAKIEPFIENLKNLRTAYFLIPLFLILAGGFFFSSRKIGEQPALSMASRLTMPQQMFKNLTA